MLTVDCPRCGGTLAMNATGVLSPTAGESRVVVTPSAFSLRRHARCFGGPHDGGEPFPLAGVA